MGGRAGRWVWLVLVGVTCVASTASAQTPEPSAPSVDDVKLETLEDVEAFLDSWSGSADELQAKYETLPPETRALVDSLVEYWSLEGGLGLLGGYQHAFSGEDSTGVFRLEASIGALWPVGKYALPIYYAVDDVTWPWGAGFQVFAASDNFTTFSGGGAFRWAYDYVGTSAHVDVGPVVRYREEALGYGAHLGIGYGNILLQGYVDVEFYANDPNRLVALAGVRFPWLLFLPSTWDVIGDYL